MTDTAQRPAKFGGVPPVLWLAFLVQAGLLAAAAFSNRDLLNADGVAYLRIASYYAEGKTQLMVSGYWGPLLSWLIAPLMALGVPDLAAARIVMAGSGLVFSIGCLAVFRRFQLSEPAQIAGLWVAAALSVFWSVRYITPDLLLAGFVALAIAWLTDERWFGNARFAIVGGFFWAAAYFAKAVAFPLMVLVCASVALAWWFTGKAAWRAIVRGLAITWITFACLCAPWMTLLSLKYGGFTFSTSGKINHAIAGPADVERYHPFGRTFHAPEPGRITSWEDPDPKSYAYWSPFANQEYARHQLRVIAGNMPKILQLLGGVDIGLLLSRGAELQPQDVAQVLGGADLCYFGLAGIILCLPFAGNRREAFAQQRWRWAIIPVWWMAAIYLPVFLFAGEQRYFYPVWPFLWVAAVGAAEWLANRRPEQREKRLWLANRLVTASFALPAVVWLLVALAGLPIPANYVARQMADRLAAAKIEDPIAGSALLPGGRTGMYIAYFLNQPWHGDQLHPRAADFKRSQARLIVVRRDDLVTEELDRDPAFRNLDEKLFASAEEAANFPVKAYEVTPP
ncbi:MAG: hypothetical protein AB1705_06675 [Verrucomicrobiota bacterium]